MPGWSLSSNVGVLDTLGQPTVAPPAVPYGQAPWWPTYVTAALALFLEQNAGFGSPAIMVSVSANNGGGDVNGVGTLTLTFTTS